MFSYLFSAASAQILHTKIDLLYTEIVERDRGVVWILRYLPFY